MPTTKEYSVKLNRLQSTRKITNTMKLVSVNKLRKAQEAQRFCEAFGQELGTLGKEAADGLPEHVSPLAEVRDQVRGILLLVATSDRGLCGGFNNNLNRHVVRWLEEREKRSIPVMVSFYGRRGHTFFRNRVKVASYYAGLSMRPVYAGVMRISRDLQRYFTGRQCDEVWVAYNQLQATGLSKPVVEKLLPARPGWKHEEDSPTTTPILEPCSAAVLARLIGQLTHLRLYGMLLHSAAGEQSARMVAMDSATRNIDGLIDTYTLLRNRARQAAVTKELIEILGGAEALKG